MESIRCIAGFRSRQSWWSAISKTLRAIHCSTASLRRAVMIQLAQSPYLNVMADGEIGNILQNLGHSPDDKLTPALTRDVCRRGSAAASITGSLQSSAEAYLVSMEVERCSDGSPLARETLSVPSQKQVLVQVGVMVDEFRRRLGLRLLGSSMFPLSRLPPVRLRR